MKTKNKLLILFMCLVVLLPLSHPMVANGWDWSGTGTQGPGTTSSGSWNTLAVGIRATAVDKNGKRLSVKVGSTTYVSRSIDFFGNPAQAGNGYYANVHGTNGHSVCNTANGETLCSKPELESGGYNSRKGGYQYEQWPYQNVLPLPVGIDWDHSVTQVASVLSKLGTQAYKAQADDLFARLMGQPITFFQHNSEGDCEVLKSQLTDAYIIFEPVANMASFTGTASEIAIIYRLTEGQKYTTVPKLYNALRVDPAVGNRGLNYFTAPAGPIPTNSNASLSGTAAAVANTHIGYGVGILAYGLTFIPEDDDWPCDYDYSYESSCASCENTNSDYLAYTIKDTSDWDGIMSSGSSSNSNVQGYYADGSYASGDSQDPQGDVYCREEFKIYFPNALSQVYSEPGRYFLLNPEEKELNAVKSSSAIPNMKLHKVYRKRECKAEVHLYQYEKESYSDFLQRVYNAKRTTLNNYEKAKKKDFASKMGTVWFRYNETYKQSKYNMDEPEEMLLYDDYRADPLTDYKNSWGSASYPDSKLVMENTTQYKLPDEYYQYIRLRDGLSMSKKPTDEPFKDLGIENIPISFENKGVAISETQSKLADIQFAYDLPDNAMLKKASSSDGYLGTSMSNGGSGGDCIAKDTIMGEPTSGYSCKILTSTIPNDDPGCDTEADAKKYGVDWNPKGGYCCPVGTKYNDKTGKCDDGTTDSCDTEEEAKEEGRDWNEKHSYCCPVGTKYNATTGKCDGDFIQGCETEADANKLGVDWNEKWKYCCPSGTKYNEDSGTCDDNPVPSDECDSPEDAKEEGRDWNEKHNYCCPVGTDYNPSTGKCEGTPPPSTGDECKTEADANKLGVDWNPVAKACCAEGTTFNAETGKCSGGNEEDPICPESECPYGCCPSGECAPMETVDGQPLCPGFGARDVIYRTIDLENPFPGQNAEKRETGTNWCYFVAGSVNCSYNNPTVKGVITREKSGKTNGHKVYDDDHVLYEITLDARTIAAIRDYNDSHEYDDFELECVDNGQYCFSDFLDHEVDISGKCDVNTKSAFISCDKDV